MASTEAASKEVQREMQKGTSVFRDVFRRADKNGSKSSAKIKDTFSSKMQCNADDKEKLQVADDDALSWEEFKPFFSDGILSTEDLEKLFHEIDTHKTNNLDTGELCDYFMKHIGPFSEVFAGLEEMNKAVSNALVQSAKEYPNSSFVGKFTTRFLLKEILGQMGSLQHHIDVAVDKTDEQEMENRSPFPQADVTVTGTRGGRMKRKFRNFKQQTSLEENLIRSALSNEINRLASMIDKLESKVKFDVVDEEEVDTHHDNMVVLVSRKFIVIPKMDSKFRTSLKNYIGSTSLVEGCLHLSVRTYNDSNKFLLFEIWENMEDVQSHFSSDVCRQFMRDIIDYLEQPEEYNKMAVPASWWRENED